MVQGSWLALFERQMNESADWDDIVVGHDFGILAPAEILAWIQARGPEGPLGRELAELALERTLRFEAALWAASREATGKVPRPGGKRWARAQDRWRVALLRDALEAPLGPEALALAVEFIYERVGCPEDMLGLWKRTAPWEKRPGVADREAVLDFLRRREAEHARA